VIASRPIVAIVDDDPSVRESLPYLVAALGSSVRTFASGEAFLAARSITNTNCLVADIAMPGMSGPELRDAVAS
jgi:FixJ family two-component response regulator